MTAKDRNERFATPKDVVEALEPFARGADLGPLVPERTPQAPTARISPGKTPRPLQGRRTTEGGSQRPKWLWPAIAAGLVVLIAIAGAMIFSRPPASEGTGTTVPLPGRAIFLMDTFAPRGIYDPDNLKKARTNADELHERLASRDGIQSTDLMKEGIGLGWARGYFVAAQSPRIVIIHRSSIFHPVAAHLNEDYPPFADDPAGAKLKRWQVLYDSHDVRNFIILVGAVVPHTQFLIYSTGTDERWKDPAYRADWTKRLELELPALEGRITTMVIPPQPNGEKGTFRDDTVMDEVRRHVREMIKKADQKVKESSPEKRN